MKFWRHAVATVVIAVTLALLIWRGHGTSTPDATETAPAGDPGYIAIDAEIIETGPDGEPLYRLQARRAEQSLAGAEIRVTQPRLTYQGGSGPVWSLRADSGVLPADARQAELHGSVYAVATSPDSPPLEIRTESLGVDMDGQQVRTADPVQIDWGHDQVTAVGLRADMKANTLRLESQVHGEIAH